MLLSADGGGVCSAGGGGGVGEDPDGEGEGASGPTEEKDSSRREAEEL